MKMKCCDESKLGAAVRSANMAYMLNDEQLDWCKKVLASTSVITCLGWGICVEGSIC